MVKRYILPVVLLALSFNGIFSQTFSPSDSLALLAIDSTCDTYNKLNWDSEANPEQWTGIGWTDNPPRKVSSISVPSKVLSGEMDLRPLSDLVLLICSLNNLESLYISSLDGIIFLDCSFNNLTFLDVNGVTSLDMLDCSFNNLTSLNVSEGLPWLNQLYCDNNSLKELDISNLPRLEYLDCFHNQLTELDLDSADLINLHCQENELSELDVSEQTILDDLACNDNRISSINVANATDLNEFKCFNNSLPFSSLATGLHVTYFEYSPQDTLYEAQTFITDTTLDYSQEALINGTPTQFVFFTGDEETETNATGLFNTAGPGIYHCEMTNALFPDLILTTATVSIVPLGIEEELSGKITIYPNPVTDILYLDVPYTSYQAALYDAVGRILFEGRNSTEINMAGFPPGVYHIKIIMDEGGIVGRMVSRF